LVVALLEQGTQLVVLLVFMDRDILVLLAVVVMQQILVGLLLVKEMLERLEPQPVFLVEEAGLAVLLELLRLE
jgi:hypothetical protein